MGCEIEERKYFDPLANTLAEAWDGPEDFGLPKRGEPGLTWEAIMEKLQELVVDQRILSVVSSGLEPPRL